MSTIEPNSHKDHAELLGQCLAKLDRGNSPDGKYPDGKGEYWCLCPFHADHHAQNFSVSGKGYNCFACGEKGGLHKLAEHLGVAVARLHAFRGG